MTQTTGQAPAEPDHPTRPADAPAVPKRAGAASPTSVPDVVATARAAFERGVTKPYEWRVAQLRALRTLILDHEDDIAAALNDDLGKHPLESYITEIGFLANEITHTLKNLRGWLRSKRVGVPLWLLPARAKVVREPLGVVLVISPWNYPLQLALAPVVGALAGGNAVIIKPSEVAPTTSRVIAELVPAYLDPEAVHVVEGGVPETTALLAEQLDHIFYTGNGAVGRVVLEAAAKHLTPVTLELGGKSPTFVDRSADLQAAARRIVWGRFTNAGQTCVAPDYVLATRAVLDELKPLLVKAIGDMYSADTKAADTYGRLVNERHFERVRRLIDPDKIVTGGGSDPAALHIDPTILDGVTGDDPVMQEEIFGPVLPLVEVAGVDEAIEFINDRDKPLALYLFTRDSAVTRRFIRDTSSGAINVNLPLAHLSVPQLPFGGVGPSGMGSYHGEASIDLFTHAKPVLTVPTRPDTAQLVFPPFTGLSEMVARRFVAPRRASRGRRRSMR